MSADHHAASGAPLAARELGAWRGMLQAHAEVTRALDAQMRATHDLPVSSYEVLLFLGEADGHRLRMAEIASRVLLSRSGLTRLVDRLEEQGFVTRAAYEGDGRGLYAQLTGAGAAKLKAAAHTHRQGIRECFLNRISTTDQVVLADIWSRLLQREG